MLPSLLSTPSPAAVSVEKATSHLLMVPDWTMNMDICDAINTDPLHAKDFVKAVKKRLQNKNPRVQFLALMLLETMIKNCGDFVHFQVVDRDILQDMVKMSRRTSDFQVRDKILVLLDSWQEAFGGAGGKYPQYYYAYAELKTSGIRFPERQKDAALIYTPTTHAFHPHVGHGMPSNSVERLDDSVENGNLSISDLKNIRSVMELFVDMLQAVNPRDRMAIDDEVIKDLASQCRINQKLLMQLINSTEKEELLGEALALFENLQTALARYDALVSGSPLPLEAAPAISTPNLPPPSAPVIPQFDDKVVEEEESTQLPNRDASIKSSDHQLVPLNHGDTTATSTSEATPSITSNALVPVDPPTVDTTSKKEDDMIDLLSLVLSTEMPEAPLPQSTHNQNPFLSSDSQQFTNNTPPLGSNGNYAGYGSYVAPWAQSPAPLPPPFPQQKMMQYPYGYHAPSWIPSPGFGSNPFLSPNSVQYPASRSNTTSVPTPAPPPPAVRSPAPPPSGALAGPPSPAPLSTSAPPLPPLSVSPPSMPTHHAPPAAPGPFTIAPTPPVSARASSIPIMNSMAIEKYNNPIGSREIQGNAYNVKQTVGPSASKPYISPDKLFEGLIELRNPDGSLKSRNASTLWGSSGDVMTGGRK